jgi:hypothetical protein
LQDEIQNFHFTRPQATVNVAVIYYKDQEVLKHFNFVALSDHSKHDYVAVHIFIKMLVQFIQHKCRFVTKMYYFTDGAGSQYKNKYNFRNLCHHIEDFGIPAEWNFFASCHGKGACDGIGGTVKRAASEENLKRSARNQMQNANDLFTFCTRKFEDINFVLYTQNDYNQLRAELSERMKDVKTISGTQQFHSYVPVNRELIKVKHSSLDKNDYCKKLI